MRRCIVHGVLFSFELFFQLDSHDVAFLPPGSSAAPAVSSLVAPIVASSQRSYEEQLEHQKEIQFLEQRIRQMQVRTLHSLPLFCVYAEAAYEHAAKCYHALHRAIKAGWKSWTPFTKSDCRTTRYGASDR